MKCKPQAAFCVALMLALAAGSAAAQILSKGEEARLAVGQCYSACIARIGQAYVEPPIPPGVIAEPMGEGGLIGMIVGGASSSSSDDDDGGHSSGSDADDSGSDDDDWGHFVSISNTGLCEEMQDQVRLMDGCNAGCMDVEAAYGATASEARKRFKHIFDEARQPLEAVGLWIDYDSSPVSGTAAFDTACDAFLEAAD